ncbi:Type 1 glutamine amidotransferase-like domain-containing protein [Candidatus Saccharibacteria bacterium]|nr:Type 1 glutamine amidotransferase-like domain-containing protein [Candidatus Saccharibacteria bacterium]
MKLLLTSAGLNNTTLRHALEDLASKPLQELVVAFIPTASNQNVRGKVYIALKLFELRNHGFKKVVPIDIAKLPKTIWLPILGKSDVIYVLGGNTTHLMQCFNTSGFTTEIPRLLKDRVYVGVSAGSYVATPDTRMNSDGVDTVLKGLGLVDFGLQAHLYNKRFRLARDEATARKRAAGCPYIVYGLDDSMAVKIDGHIKEFVGEGAYITVEPTYKNPP